jgi:hypothetical protein
VKLEVRSVRIEGRLDDHERRIDTIERGRATDPV